MSENISLKMGSKFGVSLYMGENLRSVYNDRKSGKNGLQSMIKQYQMNKREGL